MTHPDDIPVDTDNDDAVLDPFEIGSEASEADLIEQATAVPPGDDFVFGCQAGAPGPAGFASISFKRRP